MTTATAHGSKLPTTLGEMAAHWRKARRLYAVYGPIYREHELGALCPDLESPVDRNDREAIGRIWSWFAEADARIEAFHIRQLFQTSHLCTEENLRTLAAHCLGSDDRDRHRDTVEFLLVQYFTQHAPLTVHDREDFDLEVVAEVLEPVIGEGVPHEPRCARPLHDELKKIAACHSLGDLLASGALDRGREVKAAAGEMFFGTAALLAFTRFNFLIRRAFFRLMQGDLSVLRSLLRQLEERGITAVDCTAAGLAADEPTSGLRQFCNNWKIPFRAPYDCGRPLLALVTIREAAERALQDALAAAAVQAAEEPSAPVAEPPPEIAPEAVSEPEAPQISQPAAEEAAPGGSNEFAVLPMADPDTHPAQIEVPRIEPEPVPTPQPEPPVEVASEAFPPEAAEPPAMHATEAEPETLPAPAHTMEEPAASVVIPTVEESLEQIAPQLLDGMHAACVTRISCGGSKLLIASWEAAAFVRGGDETSDALQRAVAARSVLVQALDRHHAGDALWLQPALRLAADELVRAQGQVARAKEANDIDAAVNLAATATRLTSLVQEASKLAEKPQEGV